MERLTLEELKNAIREEEEKTNEREQLQKELLQAKINTEKARADKLRNEAKPKAANQNQEPPKAKRDSLTTIIFLVSIGASITATIAFFVLLIIKGRF